MINISKDDFGLEYITIENDGHFTTMLKSTYDEQQAALSTPMVIDDPKS
jgi:hypothetical protein